MSRSDYLSFGGAKGAEAIDLEGTLHFLRGHGFGDGDLTQARQALETGHGMNFEFDSFGAGYCDFCFAQLMGGEVEELVDHRHRCSRCSRTVIGTEAAFRDEFDIVRRNMEAAFGISLSMPMTVKMVNAKEIAKRTGESFTPTRDVDPRVLGFTELTGKVHSLYIENGSPRMAAVTTMAHELTHVWQNSNWDLRKITERYGAQNVLAVHEGMAVWAQIQYLLYVRELAYAERQLAYALLRGDEYGIGFRVFLQRYPLSEDGQGATDTPFLHPLPL